MIEFQVIWGKLSKLVNRMHSMFGKSCSVHPFHHKSPFTLGISSENYADLLLSVLPSPAQFE